MKHLSFFIQVLKESFEEWFDSSAMQQSASMAYFAIFSLPGLLIILVWVLGGIYGDEAIRGEIQNQVASIAGKGIGESVQNMITSAVLDHQNFWMKAIGIGSLIFGSTTLFFHMQKSLNTLWDVEAAPKKAWQKYLLDRANSLGMILIIAFLLLISLVLSSVIGLANDWFVRHFNLETFFLIKTINFLVSFVVVSALFAFMFKVLPDVSITWRSVWIGAILTAGLFTLGKFLLGYYFEISKPESVFGAAGAFILLMLWVNYTCQILFFGAEFTKVYARKRGHVIQPSRHAKWSAEKILRDRLRNENQPARVD